MTHRSVGIKNPPPCFFSFPDVNSFIVRHPSCIGLNLCVQSKLALQQQVSCICLTGWLDYPSPDQVLERICPFLVMPWRGILCLRATSFLSFHSFAKLLKKVTFSTPSPGVERRVLDSDLARFSHQNKPGFSGISSLCSLSSIVSFRESRPSPNSPSTFSDGVSSKEIYNPAPGRITPLSAPKPVPRVNKRVFV